MPRIGIVTDSTCDLPPELLSEYPVHVVPLNVIFGEENYLDGVDLTPDEFFNMLPESVHHPRTSQPSPGDFVAAYQRMATEYDQIVSLHISSRLSGTYQSALMAKDMCPRLDVTVVDTLSASIGLGMMVLQAARDAQDGRDKGVILGNIEQAIQEQHILLTVESLKWLEINGRIGKASALLGGLLNVRPILSVTDGLVGPHDKVRGKMDKVLKTMVMSMTELVPTTDPVRVGIVHALNLDSAHYVADLLREKYTIRELVIGSVGPVIGVHTGPGTVGFMVCPIIKSEEE